MDCRSAYDELLHLVRETALLGSCAELLSWDELTGMPPRGSAFRGRQLALLAGLRHERATAPRLGELLATVENSALVADAGSAPAAVVRELRRRYDRAVKLPRTLVEELASTTSASGLPASRLRTSAFSPAYASLIADDVVSVMPCAAPVASAVTISVTGSIRLTSRPRR